MVWQDPVDYGYITYEYDITMLENDDIGSEAKKLTCRACKVNYGNLIWISGVYVQYICWSVVISSTPRYKGFMKIYWKNVVKRGNTFFSVIKPFLFLKNLIFITRRNLIVSYACLEKNLFFRIF